MKKTTIASLIGLAFSTPTFATENINLNNVIVTASRTPQPRESAIADVTVINAEEIQRTGQSTLVELLAQQAGIEISSSGGSGTASGIFIRGTNASHVVVLIDGMRVDSATLGVTAFENLPIGQIDKIEILRGPASTLYGQDAIGGVIQIFTKKGEGRLKFNANLGYGAYNTKRADAGVSGEVNNTHFAFNVSSVNTNSFSVINTKNKDYNDRDSYSNLAFSGNVSRQIETGHEVGLQFLHSDGRVHFDNTCPTYDPVTYECITKKFDSKADSNQYSFSIFSNNQFTDFWLSKVRIGQGAD
jgi:vitamin B12 transporter